MNMPFITHITGECADGGRLVSERLHPASSFDATYKVRKGVACEKFYTFVIR